MASATPPAERAAGRRSALKHGLALPPASPGQAPGYPITDADHWDRARQAVGRVKDPARRGALAKLLRKTAPQFGRSQALRQSWAAVGSSHTADTWAGSIGLAARARDDQGQMLTCPECGHVAPAGHFGASGAGLDRQPAQLRTPARSGTRQASGFSPGSAGIQPRAGRAAHALANSPAAAVNLARGGTVAGARRRPVREPTDVIVARGDDGRAVIRNRRGGDTVAELRHNEDGSWTATVDGHDLPSRTHQRTALLEAVGAYNRTTGRAAVPVEAPLQPPPVQTPLMAQYGVPAIRALATPATSASSGPRVTTTANGDNDGDDMGGGDGLSPRGQAIYKRLCKRGFPKARAMAFAKRAENMGSRDREHAGR